MSDEEEYTVRLGIGEPGSTSRAEVGDGCYFEVTTDPVCKVLSAARWGPYRMSEPMRVKIEVNAEGTEATCTLSKPDPVVSSGEVHDCSIHGHCDCFHGGHGCCYCDA